MYFLRNDRGLGVKNGTLGTLRRIEEPAAGQGEQLTVQLDDGRVVGFAGRDYAHIDHGYAATVHKSQGVTVSGRMARAPVLASADGPACGVCWAKPAPRPGGAVLERG